MTVAVHVLMFPPKSVTLSVTEFAPMSAHENVLMSTPKVNVPVQLSVLPPSISAPVIVALPAPSR